MAQVQVNPSPVTAYPRPIMPPAAPLVFSRPTTANSVSSQTRGVHTHSQSYGTGGREPISAMPRSHHSKTPQVYFSGLPYPPGASTSVRSPHPAVIPGKACSTIRLSGISSTTSAGHIRKFMRRFGTVRFCHMLSSEHRGRVEVVVEFSKCEAAVSALNHLSSKSEQSGWRVEFYPYGAPRELSTQISSNTRQGDTRNTRPSTSSGPLVVNGARGCVGRRHRDDDSSDSDDSDDDSDSRSSSTISNEDRRNRSALGLSLMHFI